MDRVDPTNLLWFAGWAVALAVLFALGLRLPLQPRLRRPAALAYTGFDLEELGELLFGRQLFRHGEDLVQRFAAAQKTRRPPKGAGPGGERAASPKS